MSRLLSIPILIALSQSGYSGPLLDYIEQPISMNNLISLGQQSVSFKTCNNCETLAVDISSEIRFMEVNQPITKKRALELALSKEYDTVSVYYSRSKNATDLIWFGAIEGVEDSLNDDSLPAQEGL